MSRIKSKIAAACFLSLASLAVQAAPNTQGTWSGVKSWPLIAIHAVLTPQGKVFTWGTDRAGIQGAQFIYDVWNPDAGTGNASHQTLPNTVGVDSFCSAALLLPESGDVIMAGGDARTQGVTNAGIKNVLKYNTSSGGLSSATSMRSARWYPTTTTLPNGEILVVGGLDLAKANAVTPEIYTPSTNKWRSLFGAQTGKYDALYPRMWVLPNGRVFSISRSSPNNDVLMYYMDTAGSGSITSLGRVLLNYEEFGNSTAVMYRPGKILFVAGEMTSSRVIAMTIDVTGSSPIVKNIAAPSLRTGRKWADTVILPDGRVLLVGGSGVANELNNVSYRPLIWDPSTERWTTMEAHQRSRLYHSTALLLKDGRILVSGGGAPGPQKNTNAEIFTPPYLYNNAGLAARPTITSAPTQAAYGANIAVSFNSSNPITRATLVKTGAVTHSFDMDQRFIELNYQDTSTGVRVNIPTSANVATPGHYLMHLIDNKGVPSKGHIIKISANTNTSPTLNARPDNATASSSAITIDALANDTGSGLVLSLSSAWSQKGGRVSVSNNKITYAAKQGFNGTDKVYYSVKDARGASAWSVVTITVSGNNGNNPAPVAKEDTVSATSGTARTIDVLANDIGTGLVLLAPNAWSWKGGRVSLQSNKLRYTAKSTFTGLDKIWYTIKDVQGREAWSVVNINVSNGGVANPVPQGKPDTYSTATGARVIFNVLANDVGNGLVLNPFSNAWSQKGGKVSLTDNKVSYQSKAGFTGVDKLWYTFKDVQGRSSWAEVTINVTR